MAFRFKKASCVVVGTFNIYIVQPPWLHRAGIFPPEVSEAGVVIEAKLDEPGFRFSLGKLPIKWLVRPDRIILETTDPNYDFGTPIAAVLEKLPWTPLRAIGTNAIYTAESPEDIPSKLTQCFPAVPEGYRQQQTAVQFVLQDSDNVLLSMQASVVKEGTELALNAHTDLKGEVDPSPRARKAALAFLEHRKVLEEFSHSLYGVRIEPWQ